MRLRTCCGVFSLRTGSLIILWIVLIISLLLIILPINFSSVAESNRSANSTDEVSTQQSSQTHMKTTTTAPSSVDFRQLSDEFSLNYRAIEAIRMWTSPAAWIMAITSITAIYGVSKSRPIFVLPFILGSLLIAILLAIVEVAVTSRQFIFCTVAYLIIHSEIYLYFILVVYSHYRVISGYCEDV